MCFDYAEADNIPNNFNKTKRLAGNKWLNGYLCRFPDISYRKSESLSRARAQGMNRPKANNFLTNMKVSLMMKPCEIHQKEYAMQMRYTLYHNEGSEKKARILRYLPPGSLLAMSKTGYINTGLFVNWLVHFKKNVQPGKVILIIDGHSSHVKML